MKRKKPNKGYGSGTKNAFKAIRDLIVHGRLAPGSWTVESDLCARLGMSRTPVRAALQWLQYEGYVLAHGTGSKSRMIVAPLTLEDAQELYSIVGYIEGIGGRLTASLAAKPREKLVSELRKLNAQLSQAARATHPNPEKFADIDTAFHDGIVEAGAGPRLLAIYNAVKPQTERYWRLYSSSITSELQASCVEHAKIIDAIEKGDADETESALQTNWKMGADRLTKAISAYGERGNWYSRSR
jgi:DNA-binding GntR family transcriptional regulator